MVCSEFRCCLKTSASESENGTIRLRLHVHEMVKGVVEVLEFPLTYADKFSTYILGLKSSLADVKTAQRCGFHTVDKLNSSVELSKMSHK